MVKRNEYDFSGDIMRRKNLLLRRDPLARKLTGALDKYIHKKQEAKSYDEIEDEWNRVISLEKKIVKKWGGSVYIPEALLRKILPVDMWVLFGSISKIDQPQQVWPRSVGKDAKGKDIVFAFQTIKEPSLNGFHVFTKWPGDLLVRVNTSIIDLNDARYLKRVFWDIVKKELKKQGRSKKQFPEELADLYTMRPRTFDNYLRWYDVHFQEKLNFRLIAAYERIKENNPTVDNSKILEKLTKIRPWRKHERKEDTVGYGVKCLFQLIYRKPYKEPHGEIEEYNCPEHGDSCSDHRDCPYRKQWLEKFERINRHKEYRKLNILDVSENGKWGLIEDPQNREDLTWIKLPS